MPGRIVALRARDARNGSLLLTYPAGRFDREEPDPRFAEAERPTFDAMLDFYRQVHPQAADDPRTLAWAAASRDCGAARLTFGDENQRAAFLEEARRLWLLNGPEREAGRPLFAVRAPATIDDYDPEGLRFLLSPLPDQVVLPAFECALDRATQATNVSQSGITGFEISVAGVEAINAAGLPMAEEPAEALLTRRVWFVSRGVGASDVEVEYLITLNDIAAQPLQSAGAGPIGGSAQVVAARIVEADGGRTLHVFDEALFASPGTLEAATRSVEELAPALPPQTSALPLPDFAATPPLSYQALIDLYLLTHGDVLEDERVLALYASYESGSDLADEQQRAAAVAQARSTLSARLADLRQNPPGPYLQLDAVPPLAGYNEERGELEFSQLPAAFGDVGYFANNPADGLLFVSPDRANPYFHGDNIRELMRAPFPTAFQLVVSGHGGVTGVPMDRAAAQIILSRGQPLRLQAIAEVGDIPKATLATTEVPVRVVALRALDPRDDSVVHTFSPELFETPVVPLAGGWTAGEVGELQQLLAQLGYLDLATAAPGSFDRPTVLAVQAFQSADDRPLSLGTPPRALLDAVRQAALTQTPPGAAGGAMEGVAEALSFDLLGVRLGMDEAAVRQALAAAFPEGVTADENGLALRAERGVCTDFSPDETRIQKAAGSTCIAVQFNDGRVSTVWLREVASGEVLDATQAELNERFGAPAFSEPVALAQGARQVSGWGPAAAGQRQALRRDPALEVPNVVLEADVWAARDATTRFLTLAPAAGAAPADSVEIRF